MSDQNPSPGDRHDQPSYPTAPSAGYSSPAAGPAGGPPPPLALAVKLMWGVVALSLLGIVLTLTSSGAVREQLEAAGDLSASEVDAAVTVGITVAVVVGAIATGLWVLNAIFNAKGKQWARILATVVGVLGVLFGLLGLIGTQPVLSLVLSLVQVVVLVAIVVLIWRPASSQYYQAVSASSR